MMLVKYTNLILKKKNELCLFQKVNDFCVNINNSYLIKLNIATQEV